MKLTTALLFAAMLAFAADPVKPVESAKPPDQPKPPVIRPELQAEFWHAKSEFLIVAPEFKAADEALVKARARIDAICGEKFELSAKGAVLSCVPKPAAPVKGEAK